MLTVIVRRRQRMRPLLAALARAGAIAAAHAESGLASVYAVPGRDRYAFRRTGCGLRADPRALIAAHRTLPCGRTEELSAMHKRE